ncbi:MAG: TAT-variant-translocated molybdopterin oxidoreductase [Bryobacteraceae bacterium]|nr:TAT-variant-translocated molybdopterin oxidoreductase [Bryobacteraceae bacterium]
MDLIQISPAQNATGKKYWRSLNELSGTPAFSQWVENEFPGGAEILDPNSRRTMLKLMAASFGMAGLVACRRPDEKILPVSKSAEDVIPGKPMFYATAFVNRGVANGIHVEVHDGRPTKVEGNPMHPNSQGAASALAQASVLSVYDPDRARTVHEGANPTNWAAYDKAVAGLVAGFGAGTGLRILSERTSSPTLLSVKAELLKKYPEAKWAEYDSLDGGHAIAGAEMVFGQRLQPVYHFDRADVILSLDDDFMGEDAASVEATKQFSKKRKVSKPGEPMNRLYLVESRFSITGAMADHRMRIKSGEVLQFTSDLAVEVGAKSSLKVLKPGDATQKWLAAVARDLKANAGKCLVTAGPMQSAQVHALAFLINHTLGNIGTTVTFVKPIFEPAQSIQELAKEIGAGSVKTLVILGGNPAYTAPAELNFASAIAKVPASIYLGAEMDETAAAAKWHLPMTHAMEAWGDARSSDGSATIMQPQIAPLYGGRSAIEVAAQLLDGKPKKGYALVQGYWKSVLPAADADRIWRKGIHDGVVPGSTFAEVKATVNAKAIPEVAAAALSGTELVFLSSNLGDGRFANNAWMQEVPEAMTKLTWDNAAHISPAMARELKVETGGMVKITLGSRSIELPALVTPGQAEGSVALQLGYGRKKIGRVGEGIGVNVGELRTSDGWAFASGASVTAVAGSRELAITQEHHSMREPDMPGRKGEMRPVVREGSLEEYKAHPHFAPEVDHAEEMFDLQGVHDYSKGYQWGMAIDLNLCTGCNACLVACNAENNIPVVGQDQIRRGREMHWIRLDRYYTGTEEDPQAVMQPLGCQQCEAAPCENVCPVAATVHSPEGLNDMAYNRCVGTRYCANNCPYKVRRFNYLDWHKHITPVAEMVHNPDVSVRMRGIMEKCTYCVQRIQEKRIAAKVDGRRPIRDGEIVTACQQTCPTDAIVFGNINDPASAVAKAKAEPRDYTLLKEINTKPRTSFLARLRNPNPELKA